MARALERQAARAHNPAAPRCRFLTFRVVGRHYALPAENVAEVVVIPLVARLPFSHRSLLGLANLRGIVIPVVAPGILLGQPDFVPRDGARAIVLRGTAPVALAVDAVGTLVTIDAKRVETRKAKLAAGDREILLGAFQAGAENEVTKILDVPALLATAFSAAAEWANRPRTLNAEAIRRTAAGERAAGVDHRMLISFDVAAQEYALPLNAVREIVPLPTTVAAVPGAEAVLLGVTVWRDTLLPLLSLRGLLGFPYADAWSGREKVIVAVVDGATFGLIADRARTLVKADPASIDPAPAMLTARSGGKSKITAIFRGDGGRRLISLLAPEHLFRGDVMRRVGGSIDPAEPQSVATGFEPTVRFVVFRLGSEEFGLPIGAVDEVARVPERISRLPKMPDFLEGVINLRGEVLPVVDQRRRFGMPPFEGTGQRLIVVRTEHHRAGLIVDGVSEVMSVRSVTIEPPPELAGAGTRLVDGVINAGRDRMILLLDPTELLTRTEHGDLDVFHLGGDQDVSPGPSEP